MKTPADGFCDKEDFFFTSIQRRVLLTFKTIPHDLKSQWMAADQRPLEAHAHLKVR